MISIITDRTPNWNDLVELGALVVVVFALCHLARRLIDWAIDAMRRQSTVDEHAAAALTLASKKDAPYVGFDVSTDREPFPSDAAPDLDEDSVSEEDTGRHARTAVPPATPAETTGYLPRLDRLPVDDDAALRIVESLTSGGAR